MDFYIVLGLERGASVSDIKRAYKRLARRFHPDINPGDRMAAAQFRQIAEAYETLSDPDRRRHYDQSGATPATSAAEGAFGFEEALAGGQRELTVTRQEHCRTCRGTGRLHAAETRCGTCQGSGIVKSARGHMVFSKPCPHCAGSG